MNPAKAWACGWGIARPSESDWRDENPGDARELAVALRAVAQEIRKLDANAVSAHLFNDILVPESYANLLDDLADKAQSM